MIDMKKNKKRLAMNRSGSRLNEVLGRKRRNNPKQLFLFKEKNHAYKALMFFKETHKTEEAFYLRFEVMPDDFKRSLKRFYRVDDEFKLFKLICKWWNIYGKKTDKKTV